LKWLQTVQSTHGLTKRASRLHRGTPPGVDDQLQQILRLLEESDFSGQIMSGSKLNKIEHQKMAWCYITSFKAWYAVPGANLIKLLLPSLQRAGEKSPVEQLAVRIFPAQLHHGLFHRGMLSVPKQQFSSLAHVFVEQISLTKYSRLLQRPQSSGL
jgi:hypothetical protein